MQTAPALSVQSPLHWYAPAASVPAEPIGWCCASTISTKVSANGWPVKCEVTCPCTLVGAANAVAQPSSSKPGASNPMPQRSACAPASVRVHEQIKPTACEVVMEDPVSY